MGKALIVRGVDFSANRLDKVTVTDPVPCVGLALSAEAISITTLGGAATLTATLTPAYTTDAVIWESSDENIATVSGGVVTTHGVGTATITVHCGRYSAECVLTATAVYDTASNLWHYEKGAAIQKNGKDYLYVYERSPNADSYACYADATAGDKLKFVDEADTGTTSNMPLWVNHYPITVPYGATQMVISNPDHEYFDKLNLYWMASKVPSVNSPSTCAKMILLTSPGTHGTDIGTSVTFNLASAKPEGADSIVFSWCGAIKSDMTGHSSACTVTFS